VKENKAKDYQKIKNQQEFIENKIEITIKLLINLMVNDIIDTLLIQFIILFGQDKIEDEPESCSNFFEDKPIITRLFWYIFNNEQN